MLLKLRKDSPKEVRQNKMVPGVIYGNKFETTSIQVDEKELQQAYNDYGQTVTFKVKLGRKNHLVYIKDLQHDLMNANRIIHFDLLKVSEDAVLTANIPVNFIGREIVEGKKLLVNIVQPTVSAQYPAESGVASFDIDISNLDINDAIHVKDLKVDKDIKILDDPEQMILIVKEPTIVVEEEEETETEITEEVVETEEQE